MTQTLQQTPAPSAGPTAARIVRDDVLRLITLALGRVLLVAALITSRRDPRSVAAQRALQLRFPHEDITGLAPGMALSLRRARTDAFWAHGLLLGVTSGHRSTDEQNRLVAADLARRGSSDAVPARVLPAEQSRHVAGLAADVRPREAAQWLEHNGFRFGLYRTYANEWWHFEYLPQARGVAPQLLAHPVPR